MRKIYFLTMAMFVLIAAQAQVVDSSIDVSAMDEAFTTSFEEETVVDVATTASTIADPAVSYENPFKGETFDTASVSFDVYNYGDIAVLGALISFYDGPDDSDLGRMYFTNGSYLGYNAIGGWFDANLFDFGVDSSFIAPETWTNIQLEFTNDGYSVYVDDELAFDEASTEVTINTGDGSGEDEGPFTDYSNVITFLQDASQFVIGTGSWWSDNTDDDGNYFDAQNSYLKNITFTATKAEATSINSAVKAEGKVIKKDYFSISGQNAGSNFNALKLGIYIERIVYSDGTIETQKMVKSQQ